MRQRQLAGEKVLHDYAGQTVGVIIPETGAEGSAPVFVNLERRTLRVCGGHLEPEP